MGNEIKVYYFAYGSNMCEKRLKKRLSRDGETFISRRPAILKGKKLVFNKKSRANPKIGYASFIDDLSSDLHGAIYELENMNAIYSLDSYEMYPHYYRRIMLEVETEDLGIVEAWVYLANPAKTAEGLSPTKEYVQYMLDANDMLPEEYVNYIKSVKTID